MQALRIISTGDGSNSILNTRINETYHSTHGAIQESQYVFIDKGLDFTYQSKKTDPLRVLEIGFGTGLNALLALHYAEDNGKHIDFETLEAYPLDESVWKELNYPSKTKDQQGYYQLHLANWEEKIKISTHFSLLKREARLQDASLKSEFFDIVFFDAFAPNKQPEIWEMDMLKKVLDALAPSGVFVTYCAKGQLRRDLIALGMAVEKLQGPPGKREMIRAVKV